MEENICQSYIWYGITSRIYKEPSNWLAKTNNLILKWAEEMNRHFFPKNPSSPGGPVAMTPNEVMLLMEGGQVWSLVRELDPTFHN